jgi:geranylgeranyl diphosphate synthase type II
MTRSVADSLSVFLEEVRARVDQALEQFLPKPPACPQLLSDAMRYSLFAGGKRLRPVLTLAAADQVARLSAGPPTRSLEAVEFAGDDWRGSLARALALPAACAVEMIHTYSLIHDDLPAMDNDTLRRGRPTLHRVYGDGIAILAGDGLQAEAFALLAREPISSDPEIGARRLRAARVVADAAGSTGMVGGQAVDLQAAGQAPGHLLTLDAEALRAMHARKTGALITASAESGAIMAGGSAEAVDAVRRYATHLGLAFQIIDDVLDVEGDAVTLGKSAGKDAASSKPSYPAFFGAEGSRALAAESVTRAREALDRARLTAGWLAPIAEWVLTRQS